jgi:hypothetical protein
MKHTLLECFVQGESRKITDRCIANCDVAFFQGPMSPARMLCTFILTLDTNVMATADNTH